MFLLTEIVYPGVLVVLCGGVGLLAARGSARALPAALLLPVGAAVLIGVSQLVTSSSALAPAAPYIALALALAGLVLGREEFAAGWTSLRRRRAPRMALGAFVLAYLLAIAPVLLAGRPSFSAYMTLTDSAYHILGGAYLIEHGHSLAGVAPSSSYGIVLHAYLASGYPTGADSFFGTTSALLALPTIWTFQPFNAFALALAVGPAWLLARRAGLSPALAALAALTAALPALVYAYELIASVKEIVALPILLSIGALLVEHRRWLGREPRGCLPIAALAAAGLSTEGIGFGAWLIVAVALVLAAWASVLAREAAPRRRVAPTLGAAALLVAALALPTWERLGSAFAVARTIAHTGDPGNLGTPLQPVQLLGTWMNGSYQGSPTGTALLLTELCVAATALAALIGAVSLLARRRWMLGGWFAGMIVVWGALTAYSTTWVDAKGLVLTSPAVILLAWAGIGGLLQLRSRAAGAADAPRPGRGSEARGASVQPRAAPVGLRLLAGLLASAIAIGVLASDLWQYHSTALAPTARYEQLAALGRRFSHGGPTLFTDFDEYSLYELRMLEVSGPDFLYAPNWLQAAAAEHGGAVNLQHLPAWRLDGYRLIVTRRDPVIGRPPAAYQLVWHDTYYEVWRRIRGAPAADLVVALGSSSPVHCGMVARVARRARARGAAELIADVRPEIAELPLARASLPRSWRMEGPELQMNDAGHLTIRFHVPHAGRYDLWLRGEVAPTLRLSIDGRRVGSISDAISGNGSSPDPMPPIAVRLAAGSHVLRITRTGLDASAGNGGAAYLENVYLTPVGSGSAQRLIGVAPAAWRRLCGRRLDWIEAVPASGGAGGGAGGGASAKPSGAVDAGARRR
ncbi:MAG: carbohydrate-binding protein [Solirubrobacteraceae bacterium]